MNDLQIIVESGFPGKPNYSTPDGHPYPSSASNVVKLLRQEGMQVEYAHEKSERRVVSLNALEVWLPILSFVGDVGANIPANIVATMIMNYFKGMKNGTSDTLLHLEYEFQDSKGNKAKFSASGSPEHVISALKEVKDDRK